METPWELFMQTCTRLGIKPADRVLLARISTQTLQIYRNNEVVQAYPISTSLRPPSNVRDSLGTPRGLHVIAERIGAGQPPGMVFKARIPTGRHFAEFGEEANRTTNFVTTRILWLRGLEPGVNAGGNVDSYERYIYIHGTNHEDRIGEPQSGGCVLLRNLDMIELYDAVRTGDHVYITD